MHRGPGRDRLGAEGAALEQPSPVRAGGLGSVGLHEWFMMCWWAWTQGPVVLILPSGLMGEWLPGPDSHGLTLRAAVLA